MADAVFQRPLEVPAQAAVARVVKWLTGHGYQLSAQSDLEASLVYPGGRPPLPPRHGLKVAADGQTLSVTHLRASIFDAAPSAVDLKWFEQLVDQMVAASRSGDVLSYQQWHQEQGELKPPQTKTPGFCPECGTRAEPGASACAICGAAF